MALMSQDLRFSEAAAAVALANVASIDLTITRVEALPAQQDTASEGAWVSLEVSAPVSTDLLALPLAAEGGITLAGGDLPPGTYSHVRLFATDASITFKEPVQIGRHVFPANEQIPLFIPSADQTGIKTSIGFTVGDEAGAEIKLIWDTEASVERIVATGAGTVILPPVLGAETESNESSD